MREKTHIQLNHFYEREYAHTIKQVLFLQKIATFKIILKYFLCLYTSIFNCVEIILTAKRKVRAQVSTKSLPIVKLMNLFSLHSIKACYLGLVWDIYFLVFLAILIFEFFIFNEYFLLFDQNFILFYFSYSFL